MGAVCLEGDLDGLTDERREGTEGVSMGAKVEGREGRPVEGGAGGAMPATTGATGGALTSVIGTGGAGTAVDGMPGPTTGTPGGIMSDFSIA